MTAVANPPSYQQITRPTWGADGGQSLNSMNPDEVARMFMPRKSAQRANSSSSISSTSSSSSSGSSTTTLTQSASQINGGSMPSSGDAGAWGTPAARKKTQRTGPWPSNKAEPMSGVTTARPQSILATNGSSAASSMSSIHQQNGVVPSQMLPSTTQQNGARQGASSGDGSPSLYLLSMNGTFERKTISVPYYPDVLRIGRQTNAKTVPSPTNGYFDSKVLSRQHAEIWADRSGKVWIRDVRSSNGTFVNGTRLSAENRDSEPHELQSQDHLELGIDIVSEDQKTVVHHKVAAKVEHAGFLGPTTNVLDMSFGDLDPANNNMMLPSQNGVQMRGRTSSQSSVGSNGRVGPPGSVAPSNMSMQQQRPMNFWLTPITTEQIVKRLTLEMRAAKLQNRDLLRTEQFVSSLMSGHDLRNLDKPAAPDPPKSTQANGGSVSFKMDNKPRFTDPPAPPPQQPLPEKPDVARSNASDPASPLLKRTATEKPRSVPSISPVRLSPDPQMSNLMEALQQAKKEIDAQSSRVKTLEEELQKERQARESAEDLAKRLGLESDLRMNGSANHKEKINADDDLEPAIERTEDVAPTPASEPTKADVEEATARLQQKLDVMLVEMREMKQHMESYRRRAEDAEKERDEGRTTLAEMILQIRADDEARRSRSSERASLLSVAPDETTKSSEESKLSRVSSKLGVKELGDSFTFDGAQGQLAAALRPPGAQDFMVYHSTPYASMVGVVLLGMGLMAYMNGWQKGER